MKLILSNTTYGAIEGTLLELKEKFKSGEHILIVPDRFSMSMEKKLLNFLEVNSIFNVDVVTFNRLNKKLMKDEPVKCLTPEGSVMLLKKVINENFDKLKYFGKVAKKISFAREIYATLTELRNSGVTSTMLKDKFDISIKSKMNDIALLLDKYENALGEKITDSTTRLNTLATYLQSCELAQNFYVCGFSALKAPELKIVEILSKRANFLAVGLVSGKGNKNARIYPNQLENKLSCFENVQKKWHYEKLDAQSEIICSHLFAYDSSKPVKGDRYKILRAHTPFDEAKAVALEIEKSIRVGARYLDFAIAVDNLQKYGSVIESVFYKFNIPCFIDRPYILSDTILFKYLSSMVALKLSDNHIEEALDFVKNPLFGAEPFMFENYCLKYSIEYLTKPFELGDYESAEKIRAKVFEILETIPLSGTKNDFCKFFRQHLEGVYYGDKIVTLKALSKLNQDIIDVSFKKLIAIIDEAEEILGNEDMSLDEFYQILASSAFKLKFSLLPLQIDSVIVFDALEGKIWGYKNLFILGATEGCYPKLRDGGNILTSQIEDMLSMRGIDLVGAAKRENLNRMLSVIDMLVSSENKVVLSYPLVGIDKKLNNPSNVIVELKRYFELEEFDVDFEQIYEGENYDEIALRFLTDELSIDEINKNLGNLSGLKKKFIDSAYSLLENDKKEKIKNIGVEKEYLCMPIDIKTTSVSRLEKFFGCPYAYYFAYDLGLKRREEPGLLTTETGTIIHEVLEKFFRNQSENQNINVFIENAFESIFSDDRFKSMIQTSAGKSAMFRLKNECRKIVADLDEISKRSKFKPAYVEAAFSDNDGDFKAIELNSLNGTIKLQGKIDRVDVYNDYAMVIDYKSFKSADLSISDIYFGKKVQLITYLSALTKFKGYKPSGVFYLPLYDAYTANDSSRYVLRGEVLFDRDIVEAIDSCYKDKNNSFVDVTTSESGEIKQRVNTLTNNEFLSIMNYAQKLEEKAVEDIGKGYIKASPIKGNCGYCDFASICKQKYKNERKLQAIKIEKMVENDVD